MPRANSTDKTTPCRHKHQQGKRYQNHNSLSGTETAALKSFGPICPTLQDISLPSSQRDRWSTSTYTCLYMKIWQMRCTVSSTAIVTGFTSMGRTVKFRAS